MTTSIQKEEKTPNELQQKCIDSIDGKFLVLAGPGTGKTFTIIKRIENMIKNKSINPEEILCLTFTDAAANEMRSRLDSTLKEASSGVNICTYHGFCCEVIESNKDEFELPSTFRIITESVSRAFVKECIDEIKPVYYRTEKNDPYHFINEIINGINNIKSNRLKKEDYFYNIAHNKGWEPELERKKAELKEKLEKGSTRTKTLEGEIKKLEKKIEKIKELWFFYEKYQEKMFNNHYLDFNDMISFVLDKFEEDASFLSVVANKYKYILVDEYQDTNKSQNAIIFNLAKSLDTQNLFVVGDDDQIIYSFQGAKLDTIENFLLEFPDTEVICLKENMRSTQTILDVARLVARQDGRRLENNKNFAKYNISKDLVAKNKDIIKLDKSVVLTEYVDDMQEYNAIVDEIENLIKSEDFPKTEDGFPKLSEIAILMMTNKPLQVFKELLNARKIPCELKIGESIFSIRAVNVLISYMQALVNPAKYEYRIKQLLLSEPFNVNPNDYQKLCNDGSKSLLSVMRDIEEKDLENAFAVKNFIKTYDYLKGYMTAENIKNTVLEIGAKTKIFNYYLEFEANRTQNIAGIKKIVEEADAFSEIDKSSFLEAFVDYLNDLRVDESDILTDKAPVTFNAIQLSTYHSSKGKEFGYVFMPSMHNYNWESDDVHSASIPLAPSEYKTKEELQELKISDKIKVMYVGMTRAKHFLKLSFALPKGGRPKKLTAFIANIKESLKQENAPEYTEDSYWNETAKTLEKRSYDYKKDFENFIQNKIKNRVYAPTALNKYLQCPRQYLYSKILDLDCRDGKPDNLSYGTAVHSALEKTVIYALEKGFYPTKEEFIDYFKNKLSSLPVSTTENRINLEGRGDKALDEYYSQFISYPVKNLMEPEKNLNFELDGYKFMGIIDRIDKNDDGTYSIYDYKTGNSKKQKEVCIGGNYEHYYNQMAFYKYMFEKVMGKTVSNIQFIFPEDYTNNLPMKYTDEECEQVIETYKKAIDDIHGMKFEPTYKKEICDNCTCKDFCDGNVL